MKRLSGHSPAIPLAFLLMVLILVDVLSVGSGAGFGEALGGLFGSGRGMVRDIVWGIRIPRILTAVIAGSALSLAGTQMQAVFRNPLADPHIMGISGGAGLMAAIATIAIPGTAAGIALSVFQGLTIAGAAFIGAVLASILVITAMGKIRSGGTLLIFGVMAGFIFSALTSILEYSASEQSLKLFYSWAAGSFGGSTWGSIFLMAFLLLVGVILYLWNAKGLDIILFGDEFSSMSGADVRRIRMISIIGCCLVTGGVTAFCGPIGFVGIISPHIARALLKTSSHRRILLPALLTGSAICVTADILSQCFKVPVPPGSTVAIIGIPFIIYILMGHDSFN
ncbi:MAG: iron ABC transporter permease [Bacteroidales bacterium]|nr:iron ABC transporter permease [Bacteroidales bacterium]